MARDAHRRTLPDRHRRRHSAWSTVLMGWFVLLAAVTAPAGGIASSGSGRYGIACEPSRITSGVLQPRQNLAAILRQHRVASAVIHSLAQQCDAVFDVRRMRAGNSYHIIHDAGESGAARYFVYDQTPVDYVVFSLQEPLAVYRGRRETERCLRRIGGAIVSSLWQAVSRHAVDPALIGELAEVFAWSVDFHHLKNGDRFAVVFEEERLDGTPVGIGAIQAARLRHNGQDHYAFRFGNGYFDESAASLQKAFLKAPLRYSRISSGYTARRLHPVTKDVRPHLGIDFAAPEGTPVMAVGDGTVEVVSRDRYNGRFVTIRHNSVYASQYLHLCRWAEGLRPGRSVAQGEIIGYVGQTGLATGPHLDFRLWKNGRAVNPASVDVPAAPSLDPTLLDTFHQQVQRLKTYLDGALPAAPAT